MPSIDWTTTLDEKGLISKLNSIDTKLTALGKSGEDTGKKTQGAWDRLGDTLGGVQSILGALGITMGAVGAINLFKGAIEETIAFDQAITESKAIMGDLTVAMSEGLANAARETAKTTVFSATESAEALFYLASAGYDAEASIKALPVVAAFAQAGAFNLATATELLTDAQNALGLAVKNDAVKNMENMIRVSDVLTKANIMSNGTTQQFAEALTNRAAAALRLVNKEIEEGVAVLAVYAKQGIKGSEAGEQMAIAMRDLQSKAIKNKDTFKEMNVEVFDSSGKMKNMADIVQDLEKALAGMSDEQKKATLIQLGFQDRSVGALLALIGFSDQIRSYEKDLRSAGGVTKDIADKQMAGLANQMKLAQHQVEDLALAFGDKLKPYMLDAVKYVQNLAKEVGAGITPLNDLTVAIGTLGIAMAAIAFGVFINQMSAAFGAASILQYVTNVGELRVAIELLAGAAGLGTLTKSVGTAVSSLGLLKTAGFLGLAIGIGIAIGEVANFILRVTGLRESIDKLVSSPKLNVFWGRVTEANKTATSSLDRAVQSLKDQGIVIERGTMTEAQYEVAVVKAGKAIADEHAARLKAIEGHKDEIKTRTGVVEITEEQQKAINKLKDDVNKAAKESGNLVIGLKQLEDEGYKSSYISEKMGKAIIETRDSLVQQGKVVPDIINKYSDFIEKQEAATLNQKAMDAATKELNKTLVDNDEFFNKIRLGRTLNYEGGPQIDQVKDDLKEYNKEVVDAAKERKKEQEKDLEDWDKAIKESADDEAKARIEASKKANDEIRESAGHVWDTMGKNGINVFKNIGALLNGGALSLGRMIFVDITAALFGPIYAQFKKFFNDVLGGFVKGLTKGLSDKLGKALSGLGGAGKEGVEGSSAGSAKLLSIAKDPITLAIVGSVAAAIGIIKSQAHHEADDFNKKIQDPFNKALSGIVDPFNWAKSSGSLTIEQATKARDSVQQLWDEYKKASEDFAAKGKDATTVVGQAMADMVRYFGANLAGVLDPMNASIDSLTEGAKLAAEAIIEAEEKQKRLIEVENELQDVRANLIDALFSRMDYVANEIDAANGSIDGWRQNIADLNADMNDAARQLANTGFWQDRYTSLIKETQDELESIAQRRASLEKQISDLGYQVEKDRLQAIIDGSADAGAITRAQADMDKLEALRKLQDAQERVDQLAELKSQLNETVIAQAAATEAYANAQTAAAAQVETEKALLRARIDGDAAMRTSLVESIRLEQAHVLSLRGEQVATQEILDSMGVVRLNEKQKIDATIVSLIARGNALEAERLALVTSLGVVSTGPSIFGALATAFEQFTDRALAAAARLGGEANPTITATNVEAGIDGSISGGRGVQMEHTLGGEDPNSGRPFHWEENPFGSRKVYDDLPQYDVGLPYVKKKHAAIIDKGERVLTADENREYSSGAGGRSGGGISLVFEKGSIVIQGGGDPDAIVNSLMDSLRTNRGGARTKLQGFADSKARRS